jgi:hypothetical protein
VLEVVGTSLSSSGGSAAGFDACWTLMTVGGVARRSNTMSLRRRPAESVNCRANSSERVWGRTPVSTTCA